MRRTQEQVDIDQRMEYFEILQRADNTPYSTAF